MSYVTFSKKIFEYSWRAFWPIIFWWIPIIYVFGFGGILMLELGYYKLAFQELRIVLFPIPLLLIAYLADQKSKTLFIRGLIIYIFWIIVALVTFFVFSAMMGGLSMAAVDNPSNWPERYAYYRMASLRGVIYAQPIIFLLTAIGVYRIKRHFPIVKK